MGSIEDREKLKEEYKAHYRALKDLRQKAANVRRTASVNKALEAMQSGQLLQRFDAAMNAVNEQIARAEARLEVFLDAAAEKEPIDEAVIEKELARQTVQKMRSEIGLIHDELDEQLAALPDVKKSVGVDSTADKKKKQPANTNVNKTLGPRSKTPCPALNNKQNR
ncbi:MAG: hypothetical protein JJU41_05870 [Bacteroidetes bacterium]|nr:hypothetical protein [Bacteroidota bacterium]